MKRKSRLTGNLLWNFVRVVVDYSAFAYFNFFILFVLAATFFGACYMKNPWDIGASLGNLLAGVSAGVLSYPTIFTLLALLNPPSFTPLESLRRRSRSSQSRFIAAERFE